MQSGTDARTIAGRLMQAVVDWSGGTEQFDDTTVVVLQIEPVSAT